ncbi:MAG: SDR family oxidoreductase [Acidimicrobiia bacterium]|nr:SDR family oxidoreductase [Acidimicrobiia bacterium]MYC44207.1 SDR family oxidoreductase [Acidimicrobiia bacterium]
MAGRLAGKVAAITGSASGFGEAAARLFVAEGARVALGDIQTDRGREIAAELGDAARFIECDVSREEQVAALVNLATDSFGQLDVMYNNAGIVGARGPIDQIPAPEWGFTIDVLLHGTFYGMKHAARVMKPRRTGSIISMASTAGVIGGLGPHAYAAAKHAVVGLTKNAGAELCRFGIRVNCIAPHSMATPMVAMAHLGDPEDIDGVTAELTERSPLAGRPGLAADVANAALWLASDESGYTNGHCLTTDAGVTTGSKAEDAPYSELLPMIREAGRTGL